MLSEGGNLGNGSRFPVIVLISVKVTLSVGRKLYGQQFLFYNLFQ